MSNRLFQSVIHQMKDAVGRVIGIIDENGVVVACSELQRIGETRQGVREELAFSSDALMLDGYTYRYLTAGVKGEHCGAAGRVAGQHQKTLRRKV